VSNWEANNETSLRRSALQLLILISLAKEPARTISGLARNIGRDRSVVGKSLRRLHREGLVASEGTGWSLTAAGTQQARGGAGTA
jgi:predicted transcriptional regulator